MLLEIFSLHDIIINTILRSYKITCLSFVVFSNVIYLCISTFCALLYDVVLHDASFM